MAGGKRGRGVDFGSVPRMTMAAAAAAIVGRKLAVVTSAGEGHGLRCYPLILLGLMVVLN